MNNNFNWYKEEIDLIKTQNPVECELYSIIAGIIRSLNTSKNISLRDVSVRRETNRSKQFLSASGFPDFVVVERKLKEEPQVYGAVEAKALGIDLNKGSTLRQLQDHIKTFKKVIHTNGYEWLYYNDSFEPEWRISLGNKRKWHMTAEKDWAELMRMLNDIEWE